MFKVNNKDTRTTPICSKLTIMTLERRRRGSGVFIVNSEHISHLALVFLLLTSCSSVSVVNFEHVISGWVGPILFNCFRNGITFSIKTAAKLH